MAANRYSALVELSLSASLRRRGRRCHLKRMRHAINKAKVYVNSVLLLPFEHLVAGC